MKSLAEFLGVVDPLQPDVPAADAPSPTLSAKSFCREILQSADYRAHVLRCVLLDTLPAAIEMMLWDRAYGKLTNRVEVEDTTQALENLTPELVREKLEHTQRMLRLLDESRMNDVMPGFSEDEGPPDPSVH